MKFNIWQWAWIAAFVALFATVLLDIANVMEVPEIYWMVGFPVLMVLDWWIMPSMKELEKANRRRR